jgi:hypothetical protein
MSESRIKQAREAVSQRLYAASKDPALVQPARFVPTGLYTGNNMHSPRADAGQHFEHASLKLGAQIQPRGM